MNLYNALIETHEDGSGDLNAIINGNWRNVGNWVNPASGLAASQAADVVTANADVFSSDDVGAFIRFADGTVRTITSFTSATEVEVGESGTVGAQAFELYRTTLVARDAIMRGLTKQTRMIAANDGRYWYWNYSEQRLMAGTLAEITDGNLKFGAASGAQGSRLVGRGEHTSAPAGTLEVGEWELAVHDDGALPVFSIRYNDGGIIVGAEIPLGAVSSS